MDIVYKFISDDLIGTHQLLNLQQSDMSLSSEDFYTDFELEEIKSDIENLKKSILLNEDIDFLFDCIDQYDNIEYEYKNQFKKTLNSFLVRVANKDIFLLFIEHLIKSESSQCIEDFSQILLSAISLNPGLIKEYEQISFPAISIDLMNTHPHIAFPSLICLFSKTLHEFNPVFFNEIKKLLEYTSDPYFYGMAIYRFAELAHELSQACLLISPLDFLLSKNICKYYLKTISLLSLGENRHAAFFNAFKKIFSIVNWQFLKKENLFLFDDEDILNCLLFIKQFSHGVQQIPRLCQEINFDALYYFLGNDDCDVKIRLNSLFILVNLYQNEHFQNPDTIPFLIQSIEKVARDLPFSLKTDALTIYSILADVICVSDIDELLVTDFFKDFMFEFFGSEDSKCISQVSNICKTVGLKSPNFAAFLSNQISANMEMYSCDEAVFQLYKFFVPSDC